VGIKKGEIIMNRRISGFILATMLLSSVSFAGIASATPAFSRQINADCRTCHFQGMHALNKFGRDFKANAFHLSEPMQETLKKHRKYKLNNNAD